MQSFNNQNTTETKDICEILNKCFVSVGTLVLDVNILNCCEPNVIIFRPMQTSINYFSFKLVDKIDVYNTIYRLKENTAPGYDKITIKMIKQLLPMHLEHYTEYINKILITSCFPDELKIAKIIPIYKSGNKELPENYRPIAIIPSFAKIIESVMYEQFTNFLTKTTFFNKNQYGFIEKSGTVTAGVNLIQVVQESIDKKKFTATIFIDLKKAFETVQHDILINKIQKLNITYDAVSLIKNFLNNRQQLVYINNKTSDIQINKCGVPQGSKLAALFYIIFINDIFETALHGKIQLYADDIAITYSCDSIDILNTQMQDDLKSLKLYFDRNKLIINIKKTNYIIYHAKAEEFTLYYNNELVSRTNQITYLGLRINSKLNWNTHIEFKKNQISPFIGAIKRISWRLPIPMLKNLYYAYIQSKLNYMIPIWGTCQKYNLKTLQTLQNKAIKIVLKKPRLTHTIELFKDQFTPLINMTIFNQCLYIYQIKNSLIRNNVEIRTNTEVHGHRTRNGNNIYTTKSNSLINAAVKEFNKLPDNIKNQQNKKKFKIELKHHIHNITQTTQITQ